MPQRLFELLLNAVELQEQKDGEDGGSCSTPSRPSRPLHSPTLAPLRSTKFAQEPTGPNSDQVVAQEDDIHSPTEADRCSDPSEEFTFPAKDRTDSTNPEGQHEVATNAQREARCPPQPEEHGGDKSVGSYSIESHDLTMAAAPCDTLSPTPGPQEKTVSLCEKCIFLLFPGKGLTYADALQRYADALQTPADALQPSACLTCSDPKKQLVGKRFLYYYTADEKESMDVQAMYVVQVLPRLGVPFYFPEIGLPSCFTEEHGVIAGVNPELDQFALVSYIDDGSIGWVEFGDLLPYDPKKPYSYYIRGHTEPEPDCASGPSNGIRGNSTPQPHHEDRDALSVNLGTPLDPKAPEGHIFRPGELCCVFSGGVLRPAIVGNDDSDGRVVLLLDGRCERTKDIGILRATDIPEWKKALDYLQGTPDQQEQFRKLCAEGLLLQQVDDDSRKESCLLEKNRVDSRISSEADRPLTPNPSAEANIPASPSIPPIRLATPLNAVTVNPRKRPAPPGERPNKRQKTEVCGCGKPFPTRRGLRGHAKRSGCSYSCFNCGKFLGITEIDGHEETCLNKEHTGASSTKSPGEIDPGLYYGRLDDDQDIPLVILPWKGLGINWEGSIPSCFQVIGSKIAGWADDRSVEERMFPYVTTVGNKKGWIKAGSLTKKSNPSGRKRTLSTPRSTPRSPAPGHTQIHQSTQIQTQIPGSRPHPDPHPDRLQAGVASDQTAISGPPSYLIGPPATEPGWVSAVTERQPRYQAAQNQQTQHRLQNYQNHQEEIQHHLQNQTHYQNQYLQNQAQHQSQTLQSQTEDYLQRQIQHYKHQAQMLQQHLHSQRPAGRIDQGFSLNTYSLEKPMYPRNGVMAPEQAGLKPAPVPSGTQIGLPSAGLNYQLSAMRERGLACGSTGAERNRFGYGGAEGVRRDWTGHHRSSHGQGFAELPTNHHLSSGFNHGTFNDLESDGLYPCHKCGRKFNRRVVLEDHLLAKHGEILPPGSFINRKGELFFQTSGSPRPQYSLQPGS